MHRDKTADPAVPEGQDRVINALTVDVEDYFHVNAFAGVIDRRDWHNFPLRVAESTKRVLDLFDEHQVKATFFVLGWVAERLPALVKEIAGRGHEVACHGYGHELLFEIGPERFRADITRAKTFLEQLTGEAVLGYRAPSYSVTAESLWALDLLTEAGFQYDSSIFPIHHDVYGIPDADPFPHTIRRDGGSIVEFPLTTHPLRLGKKTFRSPIAGGGYLRLLPAKWVLGAFRRINLREGQPATLYFHPWEMDFEQPRIKAPWKSCFRHYINLERMGGKVGWLLAELPFGTMSSVLGMASHKQMPAKTASDEKDGNWR